MSSIISHRISRIFLILLALFIRGALVLQVNHDTVAYLLPWYSYIVLHHGFPALADSFSNYPPAYTYLLLIATWVPSIPGFLSIKLISIFFDFVAAYIVLRIVRLKYPSGAVPWLAYFAVLFSPILFINSADWGQCDIIFSTFLLGFMYFLLKEKPLPAMVFYSLSFAFKFQAFFLSPLILILILKRKIPWSSLLLVPSIYTLLAVPAWIAGRPMRDMLLVYLKQGGEFVFLSMHAPNLYHFINNNLYSVVVPLGLAAAVIVALILVWLSLRSKASLTQDRLLIEATFISALMPFVLPKMHERYFFFAALIAIVLAFYAPRYKLFALALQASSLISYLPFLKGYPPAYTSAAAILNTAVIAGLVVAWSSHLYPAREKVAQPEFAAEEIER